ncbi:hypothetical protein RUND412_003524 [Rhizina undulata]
MQCMNGHMFYDLGGDGSLGDEDKMKIRKVVAWVQCQLATISAPKLGLFTLNDDGTIGIGPLPKAFGFQGPFESTSDYLLSWTAHANFRNTALLKIELEDDALLQSLKKSVSSFPSRLESFIRATPSVGSLSKNGGYPIVHRDFLVHNILFDDQYNFVGVID